jgi:hypothetical protein
LLYKSFSGNVFLQAALNTQWFSAELEAPIWLLLLLGHKKQPIPQCRTGDVPTALVPLLCFYLWLQYEPELFPGLIYRMQLPKVVLLIFVSGKVVLTGMCM